MSEKVKYVHFDDEQVNATVVIVSMDVIKRVYRYAEPNLSLVGWMGMLGFPAYYFIWEYWFPQDYENLAYALLPLRYLQYLHFEILYPKMAVLFAILLFVDDRFLLAFLLLFHDVDE